LFYFLVLPIAVSALALLLPATPKVKGSLLFAQIKKEARLKTVTGKKIVLIGGSNLSFGIDSKRIEDSLKCSVVNMGLQASIGADFQIRSVVPALHQGDILVLCLEYNNYFGDFAYGSEPLLRLALDVNRSELNYFDGKNYSATLVSLPQYCLSKFDPRSYWFKMNPAEQIYSVDAFNDYGDANAHYELPAVPFAPEPKFTSPINSQCIEQIAVIQHQLQQRGIQVYLAFPPFEEQSFQASADRINEVYDVILENKISTLGNPGQRKLPRTLFFNTPYHLSKKGVDENTTYLIAQLLNSKN
jgi:hypothetical protein